MFAVIHGKDGQGAIHKSTCKRQKGLSRGNRETPNSLAAGTAMNRDCQNKAIGAWTE